MAIDTAIEKGIETRAFKPKMNIVIVGHVDHGKSTLVGRLFYDTNSLPEGKYDAVARVCEQTGKPFEFAFLLDALEEERSQGITIDTAQAYFSTAKRDYVIIDAPGHKEFLKNMVTGAASAEAALLLIDAEEGVREQSKRHGHLLKLLGIKQVVVVVNKMDIVEYSQDVFDRVKSEYMQFLTLLGVDAQYVIPVSARNGDNLASRSQTTQWYDGPTVLESLDLLTAAGSKENLPLRMSVQDVYKFDNRRIIAGRVDSGVVSVGDTIRFSPSGHEGVVKNIERWSSTQGDSAGPGESIGITLTEQIFIERGEIISHGENAPLVSETINANLFWLGKRPLVLNQDYVLKLATQEAICRVTAIREVTDTSSLESAKSDAVEVSGNEAASVTIELRRFLAFDAFSDIAETGRFVIVNGNDLSGGGIISRAESADES